MKSNSPLNLFLTGFMGAGKTSVGRALADLSGLPFHDLDVMIVKREGCAITEIFSRHGEAYFRELESAVLKECEKMPGGVFATGGGIVLREENRVRMHAMGQIIYLRADWTTVMRRLECSSDRPLVNQRRDWDSLKELWLQRQAMYLDADMIIDTDNLTARQVAECILQRISAQGDGR